MDGDATHSSHQIGLTNLGSVFVSGTSFIDRLPLELVHHIATCLAEDEAPSTAKTSYPSC